MTGKDIVPEPLPPAVWVELLDHAVSTVHQAPGNIADQAPRSLIQSALNAAKSAADNLAHSLSADGGRDDELVVSGVAGSVEVMLAVSSLTAQGNHFSGRRAQLCEQLQYRLARHEEAILAGELTYEIQSDAANSATASLRALLVSLNAAQRLSQDTIAQLTDQAINVAALLILAASNAAASGNPRAAPEARTAGVDEAVDAITAELSVRARHVDRPVHPRGDVAAHHLAAALRVRINRHTLERLSSARAAGELDVASVNEAKEAWLSLATHEYVAVRALDQQLQQPSYEQTFGSLRTALNEGTVNVVCGARLLSRLALFDHRRAWGHQATALTYALEAYISGIRGDGLGIEQAQLVTLTRLTRAIAALAVLELQSRPARSTDGHASRQPVRSARRRSH
jgi:hypothetical protein